MRVDSGIHMGYTIPASYDSMIAKLCAWGMNRQEAIARMRRAIYEYVIIGVKTTLPLHHAIMHNSHFISGDTHTHFLQEEHIQKNLARYVREEETRIQTLAASLRQGKEMAAITGAVSVYLQSQNKIAK